MISPMVLIVQGTVHLTRTTNPVSTFALNHSVYASYLAYVTGGYNCYTGTSSPSVTLTDYSSIGAKRAITSITYINASYTSSMVALENTCVVAYYLL